MKATTDMRNSARRATHQAGPWVEVLARLGYAARGIVYALIGVLAFEAARGVSSANVDQTTVFRKILEQPFGKFLLWIVVIGMVGYALWRLILALFNLEADASAIKRIGYFFSAVSYFVLAFIAYRLIQNNGGGSSGSTQDLTAKLMGMPFGLALVALIGLVLLVVGLYGIYLGFSNKMEKRFKWDELPAEQRRWAIRLGRLGYAARGVVYAIIGALMIQAALTYNPSKASGLGGALVELAKQPYGPWVLGLIALGLIAFGIYSVTLARYRRINV